MTVIIKTHMSQVFKFIGLIANSSMVMASMSISCPGLFQVDSEHGTQWLISEKVNSR